VFTAHPSVLRALRLHEPGVSFAGVVALLEVASILSTARAAGLGAMLSPASRSTRERAGIALSFPPYSVSMG
jgi:hypothetical protein